MPDIESILFLASATMYAISAAAYIFSITFGKEHWMVRASHFVALGAVFHAASLALRWVEAGHGPYESMFEILSSTALVSVLMFLVAQYKMDKIKITGVLVMPALFVMMGITATLPQEISPISPSLQSYWLIAHIGFAKLAYGSVLIGTSCGVLYIFKSGKESVGNFYERLPSLEALDNLSYRFIAAGFLFIAVMVATGSVWANKTWGSYWSWDPLETWSLISWFTYGIYLHLRLAHGWYGKKAAYISIIGMIVLIFAIFFASTVFSLSDHSAYMNI